MSDSKILSLLELKNLRSAPSLDSKQAGVLLLELLEYMGNADWFTIGIMASSSDIAIFSIREMEKFFNWSDMNIAAKPSEQGPVFLKANQKTGDIFIRIEHGLGEGILISCQHYDEQINADTLGPFPLDFFKKKGEQ